MNRLALLISGCALLCGTGGALRAAEPKLNVLMIIIDDLAPVISSYGGPVSTPALDQLAARGTRFTHNYANAPVCGASRASLLSGLAPTATRFLSYDSRLDQEVDDAVSLPGYFRQQGWHTVANGKVFDVIADSEAGWSEPVWSPEDVWYGKEPDGRGEHLQAAYINPPSAGRLPYSERLDVADTDYPDGQVAVKTVADLQRLASGSAPFFLAVGFRKPHLPFNAPERYWRPAGSPAEMLPQSWRSPTANLPGSALHRSPELRGQYDALPWFGDPADLKASAMVNAYHAAVRFVDAQVGLVLQGLEDSGAAAHTLVVLFGDHGFLLGEQRMWTKHSLLEPALRTPLIIAHPNFSNAQESLAVTDLLDVFPTLADLAGLDIPAHVQGATLRPLLEDATLREREDKSASVSRWMNGESVRMHQYRYTRWFDEGNQTLAQMLFDLEADPLEQSNLVGKLELAPMITELEGYLASQREGPVWSEQLETQSGRWLIASSLTGGVLMVVLAYPVLAAIGSLLFVCALIYAIYRMRRKA